MEYLGYKEIEVNEDELAEFYAGLYDFSKIPELYINEYVLLKFGDTVEKICYQGNTVRRVRWPLINGSHEDEIKPRNIYQCLAIDLLQDPQTKVKLLRGVYGSGKDMLMTGAAMSLLEKGKFKKIIFIRPNVTVANVPDIGYLPGDTNEKLAWTLGPIMDKIGGEVKLKTLLNKGTIENIPLLYIRGRSFENSIIYVTEGQNMTADTVKLLISRVGEGSELWINGDSRQVDRNIYSENNGLAKMVERLKGNPLFGYVWLPLTERGEVANLANLLD